ncbi:T9SS type B sorting domain-containing protein [Algibacter sp. PT7-4]|uniref:T9SS type B sorting domain-containing protein n=1 Tax=Algibacter ulvanivorans TaxID=3400999 RepID=UPI003AB0130C
MYFKAKYIIISFCFISFNSISQNTFIPDNNFEQALINLGWDSGPLDNFVPTANISNKTDLDIAGMNILDLTGIEDFIGLTNLDCSNNQLTSLNINKNANLIELYCSNNQLNNLTVTNQPNLVRLWCFNNQLTSLNVLQNPELISLRCENNFIPKLDLINNIKLNVLTCENNLLTSINVLNCNVLNRFQCGNNLLTQLDVTANNNLSYLSCEQNQITELNLNYNTKLAVLICFSNALTTLDLSENSSLTDLDCKQNMLCALNVKNRNNNNINLINFDANPNLNCVVVDNVNNNHSTWIPTSFSNYVDASDACDNLIPVDQLENIIGTSYILPTLNNGNYFTKTNGMGILLNPGDVITTSQTIYIYNESHCNSNESHFFVFINNEDYYIPKYFTPNNDGINDVWQVYDRLNLINNISIYNRYGKLIKFLPSTATSWDGTFNGNLLNSDDYWYEIILNTKEVLRGHFTLKR